MRVLKKKERIDSKKERKSKGESEQHPICLEEGRGMIFTRQQDNVGDGKHQYLSPQRSIISFRMVV